MTPLVLTHDDQRRLAATAEALLSPLAYPPEKLRFVGPTADIPTLGEFSRLVNRIPRGTVFQQEDTYLWDVYRHLFEVGEHAAGDEDEPASGRDEALKRGDGGFIDAPVMGDRAVIIGGEGVISHDDLRGPRNSTS